MRARAASYLTFACAALASVGLSRDAKSADAPATLLLIDGSGSMWARLDPERRAKIDIVREHLGPLLAAAPAARLAVTSYGHRRRGDCSDAETIAPFSAPRETALEAIAKLNPRGKGPLVAGLDAALEAVSDTRPASVVLVTDGVDNCQQDACTAATSFATAAPGVPIHVVSIGVAAAEAPRLACIAQATGAKFFETHDPVGLTTALDEVAQLAMLSPGAAAAQSAAPEGPAAGPATLRATLALAEGKGAISAPARWRVFQRNGDTALSESDGPTLSLRLDAGGYDIEADVGAMRVRQAVDVESGRQLSIELALNAARLTIDVARAKGAAAADRAVITIVRDGKGSGAPETVSITHGARADAFLAPGAYTVAISDGAVTKTEKVTLAEGEAKIQSAVLDAGLLELSTIGGDGAALADVSYTISTDDPDSPSGRRDVARSSAATPSFTLRAGTYYVEAASGPATAREQVAVGAGETVNRALSITLVPVKITAAIAGAPASPDQGLVYRITSLDGDKREIARSLRPVIETALPPGRYRVAAHLDAHHVSAEREVLIEAGKPADITIDIAAAEVFLKAPAAVGESYWEIADSDGNPVWRTQLGEPRALLAPGRYTARCEQRDARLEAAFEVQAGERRTIELGPASTP
jgi:Ca-activated chloride channel family protein